MSWSLISVYCYIVILHPSGPSSSVVTSPVSSTTSSPALARTRGRVFSYEGMDCSEMERDPDFTTPTRTLKKLRLMDADQSHAADRKAISNCGLSKVLTNDAKKVNKESTEFQTPHTSHIKAFRQRVKDRAEKIRELEDNLKSIPHIQLQFDGKKVFDSGYYSVP